VEVLTILVGAGLASPAQTPSDVTMGRCSALNEHILHRARKSMDLRHLASPVTGGGVPLAHLGQLFVLASRQGGDRAEALTEYVWRFLESVGERLTRDGKKIESKDDNLRELTFLANRFLRFEQPHLRGLGVIGGLPPTVEIAQPDVKPIDASTRRAALGDAGNRAHISNLEEIS
jgi:hypothetical protein